MQLPVPLFVLPDYIVSHTILSLCTSRLDLSHFGFLLILYVLQAVVRSRLSGHAGHMRSDIATFQMEKTFSVLVPLPCPSPVSLSA